MNTITTHVLDTARGLPAPGLPITLEQQLPDGAYRPVASGTTNADGRVKDLLPAGEDFGPGTYRMTFDTETYFQATHQEGFYPTVQVVFAIRGEGQHYHIPLLLSPYGYSTYRGS